VFPHFLVWFSSKFVLASKKREGSKIHVCTKIQRVVKYRTVGEDEDMRNSGVRTQGSGVRTSVTSPHCVLWFVIGPVVPDTLLNRFVLRPRNKIVATGARPSLFGRNRGEARSGRGVGLGSSGDDDAEATASLSCMVLRIRTVILVHGVCQLPCFPTRREVRARARNPTDETQRKRT
jgi:hypothetical protein